MHEVEAAEGTVPVWPNIGPYPAAGSCMGNRILASQVPSIDLPWVEEELLLVVQQQLGYTPEPRPCGIGCERLPWRHRVAKA